MVAQFLDMYLPTAASSDDRFDMASDVQESGARRDAQQLVCALERAFGQPFAVVDCASGHLVRQVSDGLPVELYNRLAACDEVARRGRPEVLDEVSPLLLLAVPLPTADGETPLVAVSAFLTEKAADEQQIAAAAAEFGVNARQAFRWSQSRAAWHPHALLELSTALTERAAAQLSNAQLKRQLADVSAHLLSTFEEITLLHRLTEHLSISEGVDDLCRRAVDWLSDVIPAQAVAIYFESMPQVRDNHDEETECCGPVVIAHGKCPLDEREFVRFIERLGPKVAKEPLVLNGAATASPTWFYPEIHETISVPIREGDRVFGWLLAINHTGAANVTNSEVEFGTVEACLMSSVATILGIHCGNTTLYHEQSEFFASVVRALTSAIDAKDPYTCGHSDRVARLSVCLAKQLGCDADELNTIYLSGLLHDIGKIGISDNVLRKPGALTPEELDHIKTHPDLGCQILDGVKQLDKVLPVVRHHHEAWNGSGYPCGLREEETPFLARVVAVADSIDAMSSDRPYRKGMPDDKLDVILRDGAGSQWDPQVVEAVFEVRDELRRIGKEERHPLSLDVADWHAELAVATEAAAV